MKCYNVIGEPNNGDDPGNINIVKSKGSQDITATEIPTDKFHQPLNI